MLIEFNLIVAALQADFLGLKDSINVVEKKELLDIPKAFELALHHGCIWELVAYCKFHELLSDDGMQLARSLTMQSTMHALSNEQVLIQVLNTFEQHDLHYALLKGAVIYPQFRSASTQQSRQSADIDILIDVSDLVETVELLLAQGYRCDDCDNPLDVAKFVKENEQWCQRRDLSFSRQDQLSQDDLEESWPIYIDLHWQVAYPFSLPMKTADLLSRTDLVEVQKA